MKTITELAREVWSAGNVYIGPSEKTLEIFADLVRADERNSWPAEMEAMERQVNILTDALNDRQRWFDALEAQHKQAILIKRNATLDEIAAKLQQDFKGAFGADTCASWAVWIKEQKHG